MPNLLQEDQEQMLVSPDELLSLTDARIPGGAFAMRELDENHLERLLMSDPTTWPPLLVTLCSQGYILLDGYVRWEAAKRLRRETVLVCCHTYTSEQAVVEATFEANLRHGLPAGNAYRGDYAYWLHTVYPAMEQTEIAHRVGLTQGAVSKAIARWQRATQQEVIVQEEERPQLTHKRQIQSCRKLTRVVTQFFAEVESLDESAIQQLLQQAITSEEDRARLTRMGKLLLGETMPAVRPSFTRVRLTAMASPVEEAETQR